MKRIWESARRRLTAGVKVTHNANRMMYWEMIMRIGVGGSRRKKVLHVCDFLTNRCCQYTEMTSPVELVVAPFAILRLSIAIAIPTKHPNQLNPQNLKQIKTIWTSGRRRTAAGCRDRTSDKTEEDPRNPRWKRTTKLFLLSISLLVFSRRTRMIFPELDW